MKNSESFWTKHGRGIHEKTQHRPKHGKKNI